MIIIGNEHTRGDKALAALLDRETDRFRAKHSRSKELYERASDCLVGGVPMQWMSEWPGPFPIFASHASGVRVYDVDGNELIDFCLGDTGAMFGHANPFVADAVARQARRGLTAMLPSEEAIWVAEELSRRFGLPFWQFATTATDANRFLLRLAREITERPFVLVFNGCYHGTVDETIVQLEAGRTVSRKGNVGPAANPALTTRVVEFNDLEALEAALADRRVACVLSEPAMTNIGMVLPEPGFHEALRALTRRYGTLLILDETHTISTGPNGFTGSYGLEPDMMTLGKPVAGGFPAAVYGFSADVAETVRDRTINSDELVAGIGGTLSGNWLAMSAIRANLEHVMTEENYAHMCALAGRLADGIDSVIDGHGLPWHVTRIGARIEYRYRPERPRNGSEASRGGDPFLDRLMHLYLLNEGVLVTPLHNMALTSPDTSQADVDRYCELFEACVSEIRAAGALPG